MDPIIGGIVLAGVIAALSGSTKKCRYCGKELASDQSEDRCPQRPSAYYSGSSSSAPYKKHGCKKCGNPNHWYWSDNDKDFCCQ